MKKDRKLYIILTVLFLGYASVEHFAPEPLSWIPTYSPKDKNPYGGYVLYERLEDFFEEKSWTNVTLYEYLGAAQEMIILCDQFEPAPEDVEALFGYLNDGGELLIGAAHFSEEFMDTLGVATEINVNASEYMTGDSVAINIDEIDVYYPASMIMGRFDLPDSLNWESHLSYKKPIIISKTFGEGKLVLTTVPLAFTNYGILKENGYLFPEVAMNQLRPDPVIYNRYYQEGRMESSSPFRFFMSQPALRWVTYLSLLGLFSLLIISTRRKQRAIPILDPKTNTTTQYIKTIGGLYFREGDHRKAAEKLIHHFLIALRAQYYISEFFTEKSYDLLAAKSGLNKELVIQTFELISAIKSGGFVNEQRLMDLNERITKFKIR